jgi:hypothetical protein
MTRYNELDRGELGALPPDWHDQLAHQHPDLHALALAGDQLVREQGEADPPEDWGVLEPGGRGGVAGGGPGGPRAATLRGRVQRIAGDGSGIVLGGTGTDADGSWINASKWADPPVDFSRLRVGEPVELEADRAGNGRYYVRRVVAGSAGDAATAAGDDAGDDAGVPF